MTAYVEDADKIEVAGLKLNLRSPTRGRSVKGKRALCADSRPSRRGEIVLDARPTRTGAVEKVYRAALVQNRCVGSYHCAFGKYNCSKIPGAIIGSHEGLCYPRIVHDPQTADRKSESRICGDSVETRGGRGEVDATDLRVRRNRNGGRIRKSECRSV